MVSQAIFFRDQPGSSRAIGRLVSPSLFCSHTLAETGDGLAVVAFSLDFEQWVPAWLQGARPAGSPGKPLYLPVDSAFRDASHRIQVLGRTAAGLNFALPFSYSFAGAHVCQALEFHAQRREYVRRHQRIRTGAASAEEAEVAVPCGARPGRLAPPPCAPAPVPAARHAVRFALGAAAPHGKAVTTRVARCVRRRRRRAEVQRRARRRRPARLAQAPGADVRRARGRYGRGCQPRAAARHPGRRAEPGAPRACGACARLSARRRARARG
jgi:hypothetical protein